MLTLRPPAKINLCLEVTGLRPDGYHDLVTIMQTMDWTDDLTVEPADKLSLTCSDPGLETEDNLVLKAARLLQAHAGITVGAHFTLRKDIPSGAGLGGGSSDAASALLALNSLWRLGLSTEGLIGVAAQVGSDVPFFLHGGTALAEGRGEVITPLPPAPFACVVLVVPPIVLERKTQRLFSLLTAAHFSSGKNARRWAQALREGRTWAEMPPMSNTFEQVADRAFPGLARYREAFHNTGADGVRLSGAGPALYSVFPTEEAAQRASAALPRTDASIHIARLAG